MSGLRIAEDLELPLEAVTQTFAVLAKRGVGKTYLALVIAEEMLKAGLQVVLADPVGVTWGLRSSADGKHPGMPIVVLGGDHGDVPLEVASGKLIADLVVDERLSAVLDLSGFRKGEQVRFMTDFAEQLYHRNRNPLHLVLDEADAFAPQKPQKGQERMLGAVEDLVRRGRARGLGVSLVTQRSAVLNKDVLTQVEVLVALRTIAPQDRGAIDEWIRVHGTPEQREQLMSSLPSLPIGTAWIWSPGWLDLFQRVKVRKRETFDSSATPEVGKKLSAPRRLAEVDLQFLRDRLASTIEKARADDPRELRKRIVELERQLAQRPSETRIERVEVPVQVEVVSPEILDALNKLRNDFGLNVKQAFEAVDMLDSALARVRPSAPPQLTVSRGNDRGSLAVPRIDRIPHEHRRPPPSSPAPRPELSDAKLGKGERTVLTILAQYPDGRTYKGLAFLARYSAKASTVGVILAKLRRLGYVTPTGDPTITAEGRAAIGPVEALPTGPALLDYWLQHPRIGAGERKVLETLIEHYPDDLSHDYLAEMTGYSPIASTLGVILSKLRKLGLVEPNARRASAEFMNAIA